MLFEYNEFEMEFYISDFYTQKKRVYVNLLKHILKGNIVWYRRNIGHRFSIGGAHETREVGKQNLTYNELR
jgi:hypothetical protein